MFLQVKRYQGDQGECGQAGRRGGLERDANRKHVLPVSAVQLVLLFVQLVGETVGLGLLGPRELEAIHGLLEALLLELLLKLEDSVLKISEALLQNLVALAKHLRLQLLFHELLLSCARFGFSLAGLLGRLVEGRLGRSKTTPQLLGLGAFSLAGLLGRLVEGRLGRSKTTRQLLDLGAVLDGLRSSIFEAPLEPKTCPPQPRAWLSMLLSLRFAASMVYRKIR